MNPAIYAEISGNHAGKLENCLRLIDEAKALGVDYVKFQRFTPHQLAAKRKTNPAIISAIENNPEWQGKELSDLYGEINTPLEWWPYIKDRLGDQRWACSVFSEEDALHMFHVHGCRMIKIASFELTDLALIRAIPKLSDPLTGERASIVMSVNHHASQTDVLSAHKAAQGCRTITFLHATKYAGWNGAVDIPKEANRFDWLLENIPPSADVGLSDHYGAVMAAFAAESGASMIERHLCLPDIHTPDSEFSSTPQQFREYMKAIREAAGGVNERRRIGA